MTDKLPRKARVRGTHSTTQVEPETVFSRQELPTRPDVPERLPEPVLTCERPNRFAEAMKIGLAAHDSAQQAQARESWPTVHVIGLHHTIPSEAFSHCAFTGKVLRFPLVLHEAGYRVVEYANGASQSAADEKVQIWSVDQLVKFAGSEADLFDKTTNGLDADPELRELFGLLVIRELRKRVKPGDIIAHVFGGTDSARRMVQVFPEAVHVETGIGYSAGPFGAYRIFESESWRAWHMGHYTMANNGVGGTWPNFPEFTTTQVVPNYYDEKDWPVGDGQGDIGYSVHDRAAKPYCLWVGRLGSIKGIEVVNALAQAHPELTFKCVSGDALTEEMRSERMNAPNIQFLGRVSARSDLAKLYGGAVCTLTPSMFWEPFGGVAVESLMCGTPVLCPNYAAFVETVSDVEDGVRCGPPGDYLEGLELLLSQERDLGVSGRSERRDRAIERFGIQAVGLKYRAALGAIRRWHAQGLKPE